MGGLCSSYGCDSELHPCNIPVQTLCVWAFDDAMAGLVQEPFVCGVPEMIEQWTRDIPGAESGFTLLFSSVPFPSYQAELLRLREEFGGNWYRESSTGMEGWLCPALYKYFESAPERRFGSSGKFVGV